MQQILRVDSVGVQVMATRWATFAGDLNAAATPTVLGLSCQSSAVAVSDAHAEVAAFTRVLTTRVSACAAQVTQADASYVANVTRSANQLASVVRPVTGL